MADMRDHIPARIPAPRTALQLLSDRESVESLESALTELDKLVPPTSEWGEKITAWRNVLLQDLDTMRRGTSKQGSLF